MSNRGSIWSGYLVTLVVAASACGVSTDVIMLGPAGQEYAPISPDSVWIFAGADRVLLDYTPIAMVRAGASATGSSGVPRSTTSRCLRGGRPLRSTFEGSSRAMSVSRAPLVG